MWMEPLVISQWGTCFVLSKIANFEIEERKKERKKNPHPLFIAY